LTFATGTAKTNPDLMKYQHTQRGTVIIVTVAVMTLAFAAVGLLFVRPLLITVPLIALAGWLFNSLTIETDERELRWRFGSGTVSKSVLLSEITGVEAVRTNLLEGWGIHLSRFGWLYNVSGRDAVAITLKNGKRFALGTDEPQALLAALQAAPGR
jgi:hypothetical protein